MIILQDQETKDLEQENRLIMDSLINKLGRTDSRLLEFNTSIKSTYEDVQQPNIKFNPYMTDVDHS